MRGKGVFALSTLTAPPEQGLKAGAYAFTEDEVETDDRREFASALACPDEYCHILIGDGPFSYTLCGHDIDPALQQTRAHLAGDPPWCPNGHPSCPKCIGRRV